MDTTELFAGVRVGSLAAARPWFENLPDAEPAFLPNELEAVWNLDDHRWLYLLEDPPRAGGALVTIMVADLDATHEGIIARGINPTALEDYGGARKYVFVDPDGNEIGIAEVRQG